VDQVDLHLRGSILVDQGVDLDLLVLAELVDVVEERIELVDRSDAVRLSPGLRPARPPHRRLQRIVGVLVLLDQIELELRRHDRLPAALGIQLDDVAQHVPRRHRHAPAIRVETVVDHLCGGLRRPGHAPHRLGVGLENDVDLRRHDLAPCDASHVGNDGFDLGDAVITEELADFADHAATFHLDSARARHAAPKAENMARENGLSITFHSGCHCTASANRVALSILNASINPSGARASTFRPWPSRSMPCQCEELTRTLSTPARERSSPPGARTTSCAGPYCTSKGWLSSSRWSR